MRRRMSIGMEVATTGNFFHKEFESCGPTLCSKLPMAPHSLNAILNGEFRFRSQILNLRIGVDGTFEPIKNILSTAMIIVLAPAASLRARAQTELTLITSGSAREVMQQLIPWVEGAKQKNATSKSSADNRSSGSTMFDHPDAAFQLKGLKSNT